MTSEAPAPFRGKKNIYVCQACFGHIVTVDRDAGVTPFMIRCEATPGCAGYMQSSMYRVFRQEIRATFEWYRPTVVQVLTDGEREHVGNGGLLLRKVPQGTPPTSEPAP